VIEREIVGNHGCRKTGEIMMEWGRGRGGTWEGGPGREEIGMYGTGKECDAG